LENIKTESETKRSSSRKNLKGKGGRRGGVPHFPNDQPSGKRKGQSLYTTATYQMRSSGRKGAIRIQHSNDGKTEGKTRSFWRGRGNVFGGGQGKKSLYYQAMEEDRLGRRRGTINGKNGVTTPTGNGGKVYSLTQAQGPRWEIRDDRQNEN